MHSTLTALSHNVQSRISLCLFWLKHLLFVWLHLILASVEPYLPNNSSCSSEGRAFIHLTRFTEIIGAKPSITENDVTTKAPPSHFDKMLLLRKKLIKLFDENLRLLYPVHSFEKRTDLVQISPIQLFDTQSFIGEEKSYFITTNNVQHSGKDKATVLYFHGGGFMCGESTTYVNILTPWLYENNFDCLMVDYGLCPNHTPEDIAIQGRRAYDYLIYDRCINPKSIVCAGESAGANLALQVVRELVAQGNNDKLPAGVVLLSPWVDLTLSTNSWKTSGTDIVLTDNMCRLGEKLEIWRDGEESHQYSPLFMDLSHLPPCLVAWGAEERLRDECEMLCDRLSDCGVHVVKEAYQGMFHAFSLFHKFIPEGKMSLEKAASFIKQHVV